MLSDYWLLEYQELLNFFKQTKGYFSEESLARRFINRVDLDRAKIKKTPIHRIYEPSPITWDSWRSMTEAVGKRSKSSNPLTMEDLELWNFDSLKRVFIQNSRWKDISLYIKNPNSKPSYIDYQKGVSKKKVLRFRLFEFQFINATFTHIQTARLNSKDDQLFLKLYYPDPKFIKNGMEKLLSEVNETVLKASELSILEKFEKTLRLPIQLVAMHPFQDGNGRVSKWLQDYLCLKLGLPMIVHFNINNDITNSKTLHKAYAKRGTLHSLIINKRENL